MKSIVYVGLADTRVLESSDIERMGLEQKKSFSFNKNEPQEVSKQVFDVLLNSGEFTEHTTSEEVEDSLLDDSSGNAGSIDKIPEDKADA